MLEVRVTVLKGALFLTLAYAFGATILLGLPVYYLLRRRGSVGLIVSVLTGGFLALTAALLVLLISEGLQFNFEDVYGLMAKIFGCGLIGGLVFWFCAFWRDPALISVRP